jgi:hypothetical protein
MKGRRAVLRTQSRSSLTTAAECAAVATPVTRAALGGRVLYKENFKSIQIISTVIYLGWREHRHAVAQ